MSVSDINRRLYNSRRRGNRVRQLDSGFRQISRDDWALVVDIDGACRGNGYYEAEAAIGVYFGEDSDLNISETLPPVMNQTNQVAELYAAIRCLEQVREINQRGWFDLARVVVVTDSAYVTRGISEWIWKWIDNDFTNARGRPVVNGDLFDELDDLVRELQNDGVEVNFWQVERSENEEADQLANDALGCSGL